MTLFTIKENNYLHFDISAVLCTMYVETESVTFHKECPYVAKYDCDIMLIAMQIHYSKYISQKKIYQSMNNACNYILLPSQLTLNSNNTISY